MLLNHLVKLGFNQGEAKIYLALLNNGDATASELANKTSLGRTNIYNYAKSLQERNLISDYERNGKIYFQANDPKELYALIESQKKELSHLTIEHLNLVPKFNKLYEESKKSPQVNFYLGRKEWKKVMKMIYLDHSSKNMVVMVPDLDEYQPPAPVYQSGLYSNNVFTYLLTNKGDKLEEFQKRDSKKNRKTIFIPKSVLKISQTTILFDGSIYYGDFSNNNLEVFSVQDDYLSNMVLKLILFFSEA